MSSRAVSYTACLAQAGDKTQRAILTCACVTLPDRLRETTLHQRGGRRTDVVMGRRTKLDLLSSGRMYVNWLLYWARLWRPLFFFFFFVIKYRAFIFPVLLVFLHHTLIIRNASEAFQSWLDNKLIFHYIIPAVCAGFYGKQVYRANICSSLCY